MARKSDGIAEYVRIQQALQRQIEEGILQRQEQIPSDKELAAAYGVSMGTVIKAVNNLVAEGFLTRIQGKGTYVNDVFLPPNAKRYFRLRTHLGREMEDIPFTLKLLSLTRVPDLNQLFPHRNLFGQGVVPGYEIRREMWANGEIKVHSAMYLNSILCPNLDTIGESDFLHKSLHSLLREKYGVESRLREELVRVGAPGAPEVAFFGAEISTPFLIVEARDFIGPETPFIFHLALCRDPVLGLYREF